MKYRLRSIFPYYRVRGNRSYCQSILSFRQFSVGWLLHLHGKSGLAPFLSGLNPPANGRPRKVDSTKRDARLDRPVLLTQTSLPETHHDTAEKTTVCPQSPFGKASLIVKALSLLCFGRRPVPILSLPSCSYSY